MNKKKKEVLFFFLQATQSLSCSIQSSANPAHHPTQFPSQKKDKGAHQLKRIHRDKEKKTCITKKNGREKHHTPRKGKQNKTKQKHETQRPTERKRQRKQTEPLERKVKRANMNTKETVLSSALPNRVMKSPPKD